MKLYKIKLNDPQKSQPGNTTGYIEHFDGLKTDGQICYYTRGHANKAKLWNGIAERVEHPIKITKVIDIRVVEGLSVNLHNHLMSDCGNHMLYPGIPVFSIDALFDLMDKKYTKELRNEVNMVLAAIQNGTHFEVTFEN